MLKSQPPKAVQLTRALFGVIGLTWLVFSAIIMLRAMPMPASGVANFVVGMMMTENGVVMLLVSWRLRKREKTVYIIGFAIIVMNIILTFMDEFGFYDMATLLVDMAILVLLVSTRREYRACTKQ